MFVRLKTNPECVKKSVKGERRSVLIYGFKFSAAGVGLLIKLHGRVNANVYQNLLQQHAVSSLQTSLKQCPHHTAKEVKPFLESENIGGSES